MSSRTALVLAAAAAASPAAGPTAEQAMATYRAMLHGTTAPSRADCPETGGSGIVVCGRQTHPPPRLPLPDERAEAGEDIRHPGEFRPDPGPPTGPPSRLMDTMFKGFRLLKSAVTGEDPTPE